LIAYILNDFQFLENLEEKLILKENIGADFKKLFELKKDFLEKIDLNSKEKYRALAFKI
jgi:hypothetical protein